MEVGEFNGVPVLASEEVSGGMEWDAILVTALDDLDAVGRADREAGTALSKV